MKTTTDLKSLKVHVGEDGVWYLDCDGMPQPTHMTVHDFMASDHIRRAEKVRVIGTAANAALIVSLFDCRIRGRIASLEVATPLVCHTASDRKDPASVLYHMRRFSRAPSQVGFHEVTEHDYIVYAMAHEIQMNGRVTSQVMRLLHMHPAWKPLTFVPTLNAARCAELLSIILDPRWFIDITRPDRATKLDKYLGLNPRTQAAVTLGSSSRPRGYARCKLVLGCWKQPELEEQIIEMYKLTGPQAVLDADRPGIRPGDFVWRVWGYLSGYGPQARKVPKSPVTADLRASLRFVDFLRTVWIQELYRDVPLPDHGLLFDADYFFKQDVVAATAYSHYMRN